MKNEGNTRCKEFRSGAERNFRGKLFGQVAVDGRKIHSRLLEDTTLFQHTYSTAAASFARPGIFSKGIAVEILNSACDAILQLFEKVFCFFPPAHIHGMRDYI